jgi:hypothetical protein
MDPFGFERAKEALDHSVIPTIALATHAACHPIRLQQAPKHPAGILRALIRMMQPLISGRLPAPQRHPERVTRQGAGEALPQRSTHDLAGI